MTIVVWAFLHSGGLNAGVPLLIASVPVIAEQPSANARMRSSRLMLSTGTLMASTPVTCGGWPMAVLARPTPTSSRTLPMKMYVGSAKIVPLSLMPRRLTPITRRIATTMIGTVMSWRTGKAEARLNTPADTLTDTVRT